MRKIIGCRDQGILIADHEDNPDKYTNTSSCENIPSSSLTITTELDLSVPSNLLNPTSLFGSILSERNVHKFKSFTVVKTKYCRNNNR